MSEETIRFRENEACADCPNLKACREAETPRRTSCWIRHCREKYWEQQLGKKREGK